MRLRYCSALSTLVLSASVSLLAALVATAVFGHLMIHATELIAKITFPTALTLHHGFVYSPSLRSLNLGYRYCEVLAERLEFQN
jgi:hypothetical protein